MPYPSWDALYHSPFQWPFAVVVLPFAFLVARVAGRPRPERALDASRDVWLQRWAIVFALLTIVDPLCTGQLADALGGGTIGTLLAFLFVWIGDFRIFSLLFGCAWGANAAVLGRAAAFTCIVPAFAGATYLAIGRPDMKWLWLTYELSFLAMALWLARAWVPARLAAGEVSEELADYLRAMAAFAAVYYSLWASADVVIIAGFDEGWALRFVPNQLYYALTVPFAYWRFYSHS